jgi:Ca2+-binding RTX toxin-like protein
MAYTVTGTAGNDTLNQTADNGPGTIVGLAGGDEIRTGTGAATVDGGSGDDTVVLQAGNTGQVTLGTENDSVFSAFDFGSMLLFGNEGADMIDAVNSSSAQTILGGNDSADANDCIIGGSGADLIFGNGGADTLHGRFGNDTLIGGFGADSLYDNVGGGNDLVFANEGNDTIDIWSGNDTLFAGQGNDSVAVQGANNPLYFLNEGADTVGGAIATGAMTIVGGNDSADGNDSIFVGTGADLVFGNGGNDTIRDHGGNNTLIGGAGNDSVQCTTAGTDLIFANEGDDTVGSASGQDTVFGGIGNDQIAGGADGGQLLLGNEGNDTLDGLLGIDTISGGSGADVFRYFNADYDGANANAGGPIEFITDVNFDEDRFQLFFGINFAAVTSSGAAVNLEDAADAAVGAAFALNGNTGNVAAVFTFNGRSYLATDANGTGIFTDANEILVDITGYTGTIGANDFFV